ncbi:MAG: hypothetical protein JWQ29_1222 [Phenylobacterium sp.]|jgi:hypothetical protein|nr:hypothetical protein [Phenylobacterium sp.]
MKADALRRVCDSLAARLTAVLEAEAGVVAPNVVVAPPGEAGADAQLVLFPYRLMASQAMRNELRTVLTGDPARPVLTFDSALPLDVYFLVTVGQPPDVGPAAPALLEGYRLLGFAMRALQLDPFLIGPSVDGDTVRLTLEPVNSEEMNRIWALFPTTDYRLSVVYLASPVWLDPDDALEIPRVIDDQRRVGALVP